MLIRPLRQEDKDSYNKIVNHPLQSWEWGQFRKATGTTVERLGFFEKGKIKKGLQVTFHKVPKISRTIGYYPKGFMPEENQLDALKQLGRKNQALFIKMEPNISQKVGVPSAHKQISQFLEKHDSVPGRPLFTKYTFVLDISKPEEELFAKLTSKTRYNVNLAAKKGVVIYENSTSEGMEQYIKILKETTSRQGFYAHGPEYFRKMWQELSKSGMIKIFQAVYQDKILASWIIFIFNDVIYYPYGASSREHRDVMASNLMMWEMIRYGKLQGCHKFDMWGSLGENPDKKDPWYGFHRFKKGYGGELNEFIGTYDLVTDFALYQPFRLADNLRWKWLRLKTKLNI
jgi:lipid II:glycine glycyltransferase (peptidoglycan interpeptide bridge formation enzyme)